MRRKGSDDGELVTLIRSTVKHACETLRRILDASS
jgi:hypothetical protein